MHSITAQVYAITRSLGRITYSSEGSVGRQWLESQTSIYWPSSPSPTMEEYQQAWSQGSLATSHSCSDEESDGCHAQRTTVYNTQGPQSSRVASRRVQAMTCDHFLSSSDKSTTNLRIFFYIVLFLSLEWILMSGISEWSGKNVFSSLRNCPATFYSGWQSTWSSPSRRDSAVRVHLKETLAREVGSQGRNYRSLVVQGIFENFLRTSMPTQILKNQLQFQFQGQNC